MKMSETTEGDGLSQWVSRNIAPLITVASFIAVLFGGFFWIEGRYAKAQDFRQLDRRLEIKVTGDFLQQTQARIWQLQDRIKTKPDDITAQEELRRLTEEKNRLQNKLDTLEKAP
jgi:hypothetical protein